MPLAPPRRSAFDALAATDMGVDPLGTLRIYERLAERVLPFLTVRMSRPRFLTAMAVGAELCAPFRGELAADGVTPPHIVWEWYVVEAFARLADDPTLEDLQGVPGLRKVSAALRQGQQVGAATYLKTPGAFGFHAIYARLAQGLCMLDPDFDADEGAVELVAAWEREQGLEGFAAASRGLGAELRQALRAAIGDGLARGHTHRPRRWEHWATLVRTLDPGRAGAQEAARMHARLMRTDLRQHVDDPLACAVRRELLEHLDRHGPVDERADEAGWLRTVARTCSPELRERLVWIDAFEGFAKAIEDALRALLWLSTERGAVTAEEWAALPLAQALPQRLATAHERAAATFAGTPFEQDVQGLLERYAGARTPHEVLHAVLDHHEQVQRDKPPDGRRPWLERLRGTLEVRPQYRQRQAPDGGLGYVHWYRTGTASSFLRDLGRWPR